MNWVYIIQPVWKRKTVQRSRLILRVDTPIPLAPLPTLHIGLRMSETVRMGSSTPCLTPIMAL